MDPYQPPQAPPPPPEPPEAKPRGRVPLNIATGLLFLSVVVSWGWRIDLVTFLFSLTGLLLARARAQRVHGILMCCFTAGLCLFDLWLENSF